MEDRQKRISELEKSISEQQKVLNESYEFEPEEELMIYAFAVFFDGFVLENDYVEYAKLCLTDKEYGLLVMKLDNLMEENYLFRYKLAHLR